MSKKLSLAELRMSLRRDHRNYLRYLEENQGDVRIYCKNLCGMNDVEAEKAYNTLLNDEKEDGSGKRGRPCPRRAGTRRNLPSRLSGDAIGF